MEYNVNFGLVYKVDKLRVIPKSKGEGDVIYKPAGNVFVGPSVEGGEEEYIKVVGGKVDHKKPSYAIKE
jgi:hypothetical protein